MVLFLTDSELQQAHVQSILTNRASLEYGRLELGLLQYVSIVQPFVRSLWALESSHATASDVYVFWLAIGASLNELFSKDSAETGIPTTLSEEVKAIYNERFDEFFQNDIYCTAFALDKREFLDSFS